MNDSNWATTPHSEDSWLDEWVRESEDDNVSIRKMSWRSSNAETLLMTLYWPFQSAWAAETHLLHINARNWTRWQFYLHFVFQLASLWILLWILKPIHWRRTWKITPTSTCGYKGGREKMHHLQWSNGANSSASGQASVCHAFSFLLAWIFLHFLNSSLLQLPNIACAPLG